LFFDRSTGRTQTMTSAVKHSNPKMMYSFFIVLSQTLYGFKCFYKRKHLKKDQSKYLNKN
jgi:hypothetical protein